MYLGELLVVGEVISKNIISLGLQRGLFYFAQALCSEHVA